MQMNVIQREGQPVNPNVSTLFLSFIFMFYMSSSLCASSPRVS